MDVHLLEFLALGLAVLLVLYQLFASVKLLIYPGYGPAQKVTQLAFIWLVPFVGAFVVRSIIFSDQAPKLRREVGFQPDGGGNPEGIGSGVPHA